MNRDDLEEEKTMMPSRPFDELCLRIVKNRRRS